MTRGTHIEAHSPEHGFTRIAPSPLRRALLAFVLAFSLVPLPQGFAADRNDASPSSSAASSSSAAVESSSSDAAAEELQADSVAPGSAERKAADRDATSQDDDAASEPVQEQGQPVAFDQTVKAADIPGAESVAGAAGLKIAVSAPEGAFPAGARLQVEMAPASDQASVDQAVKAQRPADQNVAASFTFDIKVVGEDGTELQPADGRQVTVTFQMDAVESANVDTQVYHLAEAGKELRAEGLDVDTSGRCATVETDGFSYYTVEFTYNDLQYVMPGDESVALADIMDAVGLEGSVEAVETSNPELFSASNETGEWMVTARQPFASDERMTIRIRGLSYDVALGYEAEAVTTHNLRVTDDMTATLKVGGVKDSSNPQEYLRDIMDRLAGGRANVTAFKQASAAEWAAAGSPMSENVAASGAPVYMWYSNGTIYWYSSADTVFMNGNSGWLFQGFSNLTDISRLRNFDTSGVTDMDRMFINCVSLTDISPIEDWDTSSLLDMTFMFGASASGSPMSLSDLSPLANWDVSSVTTMSSVFKFAPNISDVSPLANWDVSNVKTFEQMFNMNVTGATSLLSDVSPLAGWKPASCTNFSKMLQKTATTKSYLESTLFTAMRGSWTNPSTTSGTGGGTFNPHMKKTIVVTKTWDDVDNDYDTRPADGDALNLRLSYRGIGITPRYDDNSNVPVAKTEWAYNGNTWTATLTIFTDNDITFYDVHEDAVPDGYADPGAADVRITGIGDGEAKMTNKLKTHDITVRKSVTGDAADHNKPFHFTFTATKADGTPIVSDGFSVRDGSYTTFANIPYGATYSVVEDDYSSEQYATTVPADAYGRLDGDKDLTFVNDRSKRAITVTKSWDDGNDEMGIRPANGFGDVVLETATAGGATASYTTAAASWVGPGTSSNTWTYTFMVDPAETATAIVENTVPAGYTCAASTVADSGWPAAGTASLTNELDRHTLTVDKQIAGNMGDKTEQFDFTVTFTKPGGSPYDPQTLPAGASGSGGTYTFSLGHDERIAFGDLPAGVGYTVSEAAKGNYTTTTSGDAASGQMTADRDITFVNTRSGVVPTGIRTRAPHGKGLLLGCIIAAGAGVLMLAWRLRCHRIEVLASDRACEE